MNEPIFLTIADVLDIHADQITTFGGEMGLRDLKLLESAVSMPQSGMGGEYFHGDVFEMAAAYLYHIVQNHPFLDGNKRTGLVAAYGFLSINDIALTCDNAGLTDMVLGVAQGNVDKEHAAAFFRTHSIRRIPHN